MPYEIVARRAGDPVATYADPYGGEEVLGWRARQGLPRSSKRRTGGTPTRSDPVASFVRLCPGIQRHSLTCIARSISASRIRARWPTEVAS